MENGGWATHRHFARVFYCAAERPKPTFAYLGVGVCLSPCSCQDERSWGNRENGEKRRQRRWRQRLRKR